MVYKHAISTVVPSRNVRVGTADGHAPHAAPTPEAHEENEGA